MLLPRGDRDTSRILGDAGVLCIVRTAPKVAFAFCVLLILLMNPSSTHLTHFFLVDSGLILRVTTASSVNDVYRRQREIGGKSLIMEDKNHIPQSGGGSQLT